MDLIAEEIVAKKLDVIVLVTPHARREPRKYSYYSDAVLTCNFKEFGVSNVESASEVIRIF